MQDWITDQIDQECKRWGGGIHIKHELMTGIHSFFYERIPPGSKVLDVGCGDGAVAYSMVEHADARVIGIDFSSESVDGARNRYRHPSLSFQEGDVTKGLPSTPVDVAVLSSVIEHVADRVGLLRRLTERCTPSLFLIRVPTLERHYYTALKRELGMFYFTDPTHVLEYSPSSFTAEMEEAGLEVSYMEIRWGDIWAECRPRSSPATPLGERSEAGGVC